MTRDRSLDIAVTGISARFPGTSSLSGWWSAVIAGQVLTTRYTQAQLAAAGVPAAEYGQPGYVPVRGHLDRAEHFDNHLFGISPRDARLLDPQHRLMLETAWSALEDDANGLRDGRTRTAVFASATGSAYLRAILSRGLPDAATLDDLIHGTEHDFMASRIAYKLGLTGPALAVQTACSSSLVAVYLATQALLNGDCDRALVVAAGYTFPQAGYVHIPGGVQSRSGRCRPFDASADGVVAGSGVAGVVLRRLDDALRDGPELYGVILGGAVTNDGAQKAGFYAPSVAGQRAAIRGALDAAGVTGDSIGYLEAHGTGTPLGDPIEWAAASTAYRSAGAREGQIALGAVKANMGHLDAAAGLTALIKALLVVREGVIPPIPGFSRLNPEIEAEDAPLHVPTEPAPWPAGAPRRAGVSAFGIGGTNAHLVLEQPPVRAVRMPKQGPASCLVALSAADGAALARMADRLAEHLESVPVGLAEVAATLAHGRAGLPERLVVAGSTGVEVARRLRDGSGVVRGLARSTGAAPVVFLLPGQGTQHPGMAMPYLEGLPGFARALEDCVSAFPGALREQLRAVLTEPGRPADLLEETALAQPAVFAVGYASAVALMDLGVRPVAAVGHSLGEITAACVAGVLALPDAAAFVAARGRAMQGCPPGAMLALRCSPVRAEQLARQARTNLEVAAVNGPDNCVLAGLAEEVSVLQDHLGDEVFNRRLRGNRAFHSRYVEPALAAIRDALAPVTLHPGRMALGSNIDGRLVAVGSRPEHSSLVDQARAPVKFGALLKEIARELPGALLVELAPGSGLSSMAEECGLATVALGDPVTDTDAPVLTALGALWAAGQPVESRLWADSGERVHLPTYPFAGPRWVAAAAEPDAERDPRPPAVASELAVITVAAPEGGALPPLEPDPRSVLEAAWTDLLGYPEITDASDFFDLGGDSLLVTRLARRISAELGVQVEIRALLGSRTFGRQALLLASLVTARSAGRAGV